ncbi:MAG: sulfurtransferase [Nitrososphaerales archaeon]
MKAYKGYRNPELVISVDGASRMINNKDVIFVDTRNYWKYAKGHIPGAHNFELYAFHWIDTSRKGLQAFVKQMEFLVSSIGVEDGKQVIFYQNNSGYDAARGVWLLNYLGHKNARLLDGGLNLWKRKKLPLSVEDPKIKSRSNFVAKPDPSEIATLGFLSAYIQTKQAPQIIDVRNAGEFSGKYRRALKTGRIPGSVNVEWKLALRRDGTLKDSAQLKKLYSGLEGARGMVTYCQSGYRAAHSWLVLKLLGYDNVRNYLGSWYEWGNNPEV